MGSWASFINSAVGATALTGYWLGSLKDWTTRLSGRTINIGQYALHGGNIYKCTAITASNAAVSNNAPVGGIGADTITWTLLRAATPLDVSGRMYTKDEAYVDPNGKLSTIKTQLMNPAVAYDERVCIIQIGQSEKSLASTYEEYLQALVNTVEFMLEDSTIKVGIGCTVYFGGGPTQPGDKTGPEYYRDVLDPAYFAALAYFSGNPRVFASNNLYRELAVGDPFSNNLPVTTIQNSGTPALKGFGADNSGIHMNNAACRQAGLNFIRNLQRVNIIRHQ